MFTLTDIHAPGSYPSSYHTTGRADFDAIAHVISLCVHNHGQHGLVRSYRHASVEDGDLACQTLLWIFTGNRCGDVKHPVASCMSETIVNACSDYGDALDPHAVY